MSRPAIDIDLLRSAVDTLPQNGLSDIRQSALQEFAKHNLPDRSVEDWRYTRLDHYADVANQWLKDATVEKPANAKSQTAADPKLPDIDADWIVLDQALFLDGSLNAINAQLPDGLSVTRHSDLPAAANNHFQTPLSVLNDTLRTDGLLIKADKHFKAERPLGLYCADGDENTLTQRRVDIHLEHHAELSVLEYQGSFGTSNKISNTVIHVELAAGAMYRHIRFQQRDNSHSSSNLLTAVLGDNSQLRHFAIDLGGSLTRNDLMIDLQGKAADAELCGLYLPSGQQHIDNHLSVVHSKGPGRSLQNYRGVLTDKSEAVFNAKAIVAEGADGTDANQSNHNILLSNHAQINTKPELEINADEVKCSHGATVGQLDEDALFYLQARGIDQQTARQILITAFAMQTLSNLGDSEFATLVRDQVDQKLKTLSQS